MSREHLLVGCGSVLALLPFSGLPLMWRTWGNLGLGVLVVIIGSTLIMRKRRASRHAEDTTRATS